MHDQYTIDDGETKKDKWNRGLDLFIESVLKPDPKDSDNVLIIKDVIMNLWMFVVMC